jgi:hypothetical protein
MLQHCFLSDTAAMLTGAINSSPEGSSGIAHRSETDFEICNTCSRHVAAIVDCFPSDATTMLTGAINFSPEEMF